jgi:Ca-activated chloride channel family protein
VDLECLLFTMMRGSLLLNIGATAALVLSAAPLPAAQEKPIATFKSGVELVRLNAVVRDKKGRFVQNLTVRDFEVFDGGIPRQIKEFRPDTGDISIALLFDVSGSMESRLSDARDAARHVLSWLDRHQDEAAIFTFDTRLAEVTPFTAGLKQLPGTVDEFTPFGATSLHDAIGETADRLSTRPGIRRAVVVFTDGIDTASRLTAAEVSAAASAIDVPVYIFAVVPSIDNPTAENTLIGEDKSPLAGALADLAAWTGGHVFVASVPAERSASARQIIDELRHQYLIAFESSGRPGWHPLVVRARGKDLTVRARSGYIAGQSRPIS